ncbi:ABC transporter permease [Tessaracoccus antarcticus]|uniref:ABC transporter permease n=1 Tax=Tessaracoccus antarcticus TaxID=2479848 RepID=A0A3M0G9U3_9ACTN|nr:ABC transporter permease [Tessaracoccus antarcticus]RMB61654.1 ABC transporter permease [Tessaracoccus antarcticus]
MTGFTTVLRLLFRRNWVFWLIWVVVLAMLMPATLSQYATLVPAGSAGELMLEGLAGDPTMRAILGPPFDLTLAGGFAFWRVGAFTAIAAAMMSGLGIIRATRAEEEEGRIELIRSGAVGRHVPLAAAVALALVWNLVLGVAVTASMAALTTPWAGALASGLAIALCGATFTGVGAVMAQLFTSARTARYWTLGIALGGLYLLRAIVDGSQQAGVTNRLLDALQWANPLSWPALVRPYADERFWVLLLPVALTALLLALALVLESRRDHGSGIRASSPGRAEAAPYLSNVWGLAWRLHRGGVIGWSAGMVIAAAGIGPLAHQVTGLIASNSAYSEMLRRMGGGAEGIVDAFYIAMLGILVTFIGLMGVSMLGRLNSEETAGHAEVMLATATPRTALAGSHLAIGGGLAVLLSLMTGALLAVTASSSGTWEALGTGAAAAAALLPGTVVVVGLAMLLIGWAPRAFSIVWAVIGWSIFASWVGALLQFPDWLLRLQPWGHLPKLPTDDLTWSAIVVESIIGLALLGLGLAGYRRRDIRGR